MIVLFATACGPASIEDSSWVAFDLAYVAAPDGGDNRRVRVTSSTGIEGVDLMPAPLVSDNVAWSSDGERLVYLLADELQEHGAAETYVVRIADSDGEVERGRISTMWFGRPPADSAVVLSWARGDRYLSAAIPGASWAAQRSMPGMNSWLVDLEAADDPVARPVSGDAEAAPGVWSEDGHALAFAEHYLVCGDEGDLTSYGWSVRGLDVAEDRSLGSLVDGAGPHVWAPAWSPRGRTLAANAGDRNAVPRISRVVAMEPSSATARVVFEVAGCSAELGGWFPDADRLLIRETCGGREARHLVVDAASGAVLDELADLGANVAIAPAGDRVAHLVDLDGEAHVAVHEIDSGDSTTIGPGTGPAWRPL